MGPLSIVNILILITGIITIIFAARAYLRFLEGEFKTLLRWILYAFFLFIIYKALAIMALRTVTPSAFLVISDLIFLLAILCLLIAVRELHAFSKTFGFREHTMPGKQQTLKKTPKRTIP